jgi:hypothetical protein
MVEMLPVKLIQGELALADANGVDMSWVERAWLTRSRASKISLKPA